MTASHHKHRCFWKSKTLTICLEHGDNCVVLKQEDRHLQRRGSKEGQRQKHLCSAPGVLNKFTALNDQRTSPLQLLGKLQL